MRGHIRRSTALLLTVLLSAGMLEGCGIGKSAAAEKGLVIAEDSDWKTEGSAEPEEDSGSGDTADGENDGAQTGTTGTKEDPEDEEETTIYVYVCGQVREAGVYQMPYGCRIYQVIEEAGGVTEEADISAVNQAAKAEDGQKIYIPEEGELLSGASEGDDTASGQVSGAEEISGVSGDGKVNINTADKDELMTLSGIGESRAESIVKYREEHGSFSRTEELKNISGIGDGIYNKIREDICV